MAHFSVTTDTIVTSGDGRTLVAVADTLFVGRNATLGSAALDGRGVVMQAASQMVNVAGTIIGATGIDAVGTGGTINILTGGIISTSATAIDTADGLFVRNDAMISANQGIFSGGSLSVVNTGHSSGATSAIFVTGAATVRNTGTISATSTAVFIDGLARVSDLLSGLAGADVVRGQNGADEMFGGDSNDQLFGGSQRDSLNGNAGNDRLSGGTDVDRLAGGAGDDIFVFVAFEEFRALSGSGRDLIVDFTPGEDLIDLSEPDANAGTAGDQAFRFQGTSPVNAFGQLSYRFVGGTTVISIGYDTPETFDVLISNGQIPLSPPDFVL